MLNQEFITELLSLAPAFSILNFKAFAFLGEALVLLFIGKLLNDLFTSYDLNEELTTRDNKAIALEFSGYMIALGIIIQSIVTGESKGFIYDLISIFVWGVAGILLLNLSRLFINHLLLARFDITKELVRDKNCGTGAVLFGSYIGTGFIIKAALSGEPLGLVQEIVAVAIFYILGQLGFILFSHIYQMFTKFDFHKEIEADNSAAGVSLGLSLAAIGMLLSGSILATNSLIALAAWLINGTVLLFVTRVLVDKLIMPARSLDREIHEDRNWGAGLIEGAIAFIVAFIINAAFI